MRTDDHEQVRPEHRAWHGMGEAPCEQITLTCTAWCCLDPNPPASLRALDVAAAWRTRRRMSTLSTGQMRPSPVGGGVERYVVDPDDVHALGA